MTCRGRSRLSATPGGAAVAGPGSHRGAPGAYLAWRERPDETEDVFPEGSCGCGADLAGAADLGVRHSRQVTDLPEAQAQTTQYDRHVVQCACGRVHLADVPLTILASVICGDETPLRAGLGPTIRKKYLQVACTNLPLPPPGRAPLLRPDGLFRRRHPGVGDVLSEPAFQLRDS